MSIMDGASNYLAPTFLRPREGTRSHVLHLNASFKRIIPQHTGDATIPSVTTAKPFPH